MHMGPFNCYMMQWYVCGGVILCGVREVKFPEKSVK